MNRSVMNRSVESLVRLARPLAAGCSRAASGPAKRGIVAAMLLTLASLTRADAPPVLDAKAVVEKSIDAAGGKEKLSAVKSMTVAGTIAMPAQAINGTLTLFRAPGKAVVIVEIPGITTVRSGIVGDVAYESSELLGSRLLGEVEKRRLLDGMDPQAQFDRLGELKDMKVEAAGKIGDADVWKLSGVNAEGDAETHWIDAKTFLTLKSEMVIQHLMGKIPATIDFSDFKTIDGITFPTVMKQQAAGANVISTLADIKINPDIPDATFALPPDVQKLVDKQSKKPAATQPVNP